MSTMVLKKSLEFLVKRVNLVDKSFRDSVLEDMLTSLPSGPMQFQPTMNHMTQFQNQNVGYGGVNNVAPVNDMYANPYSAPQSFTEAMHQNHMNTDNAAMNLNHDRINNMDSFGAAKPLYEDHVAKTNPMNLWKNDNSILNAPSMLDNGMDFAKNDFVEFNEKPNNFIEQNNMFMNKNQPWMNNDNIYNDPYNKPYEIPKVEPIVPDYKPIEPIQTRVTDFGLNRVDDYDEPNNFVDKDFGRLDNDKPLFGYDLPTVNKQIHFHGKDEDHLTHGHLKDYGSNQGYGSFNGHESSMLDSYANNIGLPKIEFNKPDPIEIVQPKINNDWMNDMPDEVYTPPKLIDTTPKVVTDWMDDSKYFNKPNPIEIVQPKINNDWMDDISAPVYRPPQIIQTKLDDFEDY